MRILLTNDDGIDAPGLRALEAAIPPEIQRIVVAPEGERSECGHSVTTRREILVTPRGPGRWAVSGTPADCVRVAIAVLNQPLSGVIAGVNDGGNLGADIYMSGTVAAAREAALHALPSVAVSHYRRPDIPRSWDHVPRWLEGLLLPLLTSEHRRGSFWNVNLPAVTPEPVPSRVLADLDREPMAIRYREIDPRQAVDQELDAGRRLRYTADYQGRPRRPGSDVSACFDGSISLTQIRLGF